MQLSVRVVDDGVMRPLALRLCIGLALAADVAGCGQETPPVPEQVRAIKTFTVTEVAEGQVRHFSGLIEAKNTSALSFQVGGSVRDVRVNQGDTVRAAGAGDAGP
jgi:multidrug efflux pump subunit AcrA (membrane-fusion protein)